MRSARLRTLPDFLIIGTQRGGTSSLFIYLARHPCVLRSLRKETEYFSRRYALGPEWYRAHFPIRSVAAWRRWRGGRPLTFEATPDYLFHPYAAERARDVVPEAKLIVLLRDPVERAVSHYRHMVRLGFETLPFREAIEVEARRTAADLEALRRDPLHQARDLLRFSYVARGRYAEQLERWMEVFPRDRFLIVRSEDLFRDPGAVYERVITFLGLPLWRPRVFPNVTVARAKTSSLPPFAEVTPDARARLREAFAPHDERLYALIGRDFGWELRSG